MQVQAHPGHLITSVGAAWPHMDSSDTCLAARTGRRGVVPSVSPSALWACQCYSIISLVAPSLFLVFARPCSRSLFLLSRLEIVSTLACQRMLWANKLSYIVQAGQSRPAAPGSSSLLFQFPDTLILPATCRRFPVAPLSATPSSLGDPSPPAVLSATVSVVLVLLLHVSRPVSVWDPGS